MDGEEVETSSSPGPFLICEHMILISAISKPVKMTKNIQKVICTEDVLSWETAAMAGKISCITQGCRPTSATTHPNSDAI